MKKKKRILEEILTEKAARKIALDRLKELFKESGIKDIPNLLINTKLRYFEGIPWKWYFFFTLNKARYVIALNPKNGDVIEIEPARADYKDMVMIHTPPPQLMAERKWYEYGGRALPSDDPDEKDYSDETEEGPMED